MDIHPPTGPTESFKDFAIHILIVTIGILIALSLEGIRESLHEHRLVRDARENFRVELTGNKAQLVKELQNVKETNAQIDQIVADLPKLKDDPVKLKNQVAALHPSGYFLSSASWETAVSSGAISHMSTSEVNKYVGVNITVRSYTEFEDKALTSFFVLESFFASRKTFTPEDINQGEERLRMMQGYERVMSHVGQECMEGIDDALKGIS